MSEPRTELIDNVHHPKHYTECSLECIDAMILAFGATKTVLFCQLNAFKYLWRYKSKNGAEDICKAEWYANKAVELSRLYSFTDPYTVDVTDIYNIQRFIKELKKQDEDVEF